MTENSKLHFADSNIVLYALIGADRKARRAIAIIGEQPVISAQVLNEVTSVMRKKYRMDWDDILDSLTNLKSHCRVEALTEATHALAVSIAMQNNLNIYDANIIAAAELAGCDVLYTEDMSNGQRIGRVTIRNPFVTA